MAVIQVIILILSLLVLQIIKMKTNETLSGFIPTRSLIGSGKDKQPYKEKSKSKDRKKDYSDARKRKRGEYEQ